MTINTSDILPEAHIYSLNKLTEVYEYRVGNRVASCTVQKSTPEEAKRYAWLRLSEELNKILLK
jgi:hypothetical protein